MNSLFYAMLAWTNLKNNSKTYIPYIITSIGSVLMFYNICNLTFHPATTGNVKIFMYLGTYITGIFAVIFLSYTNSFLIKRRKKEFGLFNILGMEKRHIGKVMLWETFIVAVLSLITGLVLGVIFSKLVTLLLYKLLNFIPDYNFVISGTATLLTLGLFCLIFLISLLYNLTQVHTANPITLLRGGNVGEKEPKTKWFVALLGFATLGAGYYIALTIKEPLASLQMFFVAAILVIIGTYCLFTAGSIWFLKLLKKNKNYYYQTKHFTAVSGMIYRMKQNAAGLANICIMSTIVLVMISSTVSLYAGMVDIIKLVQPTDFQVQVNYKPQDKLPEKKIEQAIYEICAQQKIAVTDYEKSTTLEYSCTREGNIFTPGADRHSTSNNAIIKFLTAADYQRLTGKHTALKNNQILLYNSDPTLKNDITIFDEKYFIAESLATSPIKIDPRHEALATDFSCIVVANDEIMNKAYQQVVASYGSKGTKLVFQIAFNSNQPIEKDKEAHALLKSQLTNANIGNSFVISSQADSTDGFYELYGGLFFLGIFLGILFLMATALIIYYKQIVEGFEDKERFKIMQKVGMSHEEVKKTISSQVLTVFFLPILVAIIHIVVAFPIMTKLLAILNLTNIPLFVTSTIATVLIFMVIYGLVYMITARAYYSIVNN